MSGLGPWEAAATRLREHFHNAIMKEEPEDFTIVLVCMFFVAEVLSQMPEPERKRRTKGVGLMLQDMLATIAEAEVLQ